MKLTLRLRWGRMPMPPMITSNLPVRRAGMMPDHLVGTNSTLTPMSLAKRVATSISKPTNLPVLSFMAQGTKVEKPTRSTPLFKTCSTVDSWVSCWRRSWARAGAAKARVRIRAARMPKLKTLRVFICLSIYGLSDIPHNHNLNRWVWAGAWGLMMPGAGPGRRSRCRSRLTQSRRLHYGDWEYGVL